MRVLRSALFGKKKVEREGMDPCQRHLMYDVIDGDRPGADITSPPLSDIICEP